MLLPPRGVLGYKAGVLGIEFGIEQYHLGKAPLKRPVLFPTRGPVIPLVGGKVGRNIDRVREPPGVAAFRWDHNRVSIKES